MILVDSPNSLLVFSKRTSENLSVNVRKDLTPRKKNDGKKKEELDDGDDGQI